MLNEGGLKSALSEYLGPDSSLSLYKVSNNVYDVIAVSNIFKNLTTTERTDLIRNWVKEFTEDSTQLGFISLYTVSEAISLDLRIDELSKPELKLQTWFDLINSDKVKVQLSPDDNAKVVSFYSFKGGVGRTTALIHVAWILAQRGKKIVIVDMDLEAPSLHQALGPLKITPKKGLVDYLYERVNSLNDDEFDIQIADIIGEVASPKGSIFLVPAGNVTTDYISKVDDLRNLRFNDEEIWKKFREDLTDQLHPDIILVDSRTGINIWGALSLLQIADETMIFMNPTPQNTEGITSIVQSLYRVGQSPFIILSPVISGKAGKERALREWKKVNSVITENSLLEYSDDNDDPIMIPFTTEVALSDEYPNKSYIHLYNDIANQLDEETDKHILIQLLSSHERWRVLEDLSFSSIDAKEEKGTSVKALFQKTADFERFLDQATILIKGKKGTGKTQLYWTAINHLEIMRELAQSRLDRVIPISGHGPASGHPLRDDFNYINEELFQSKSSWESFWRGYALYRLIINKEAGLELPRNKHFEDLRNIFKKKPKSNEMWTSEHTKFVLSLSTNNEVKLLIRDALEQASKKLYDKNMYIWLLYDDLDQDIPEYSLIQKEAISGLFIFALTLENMQVRTIRPKIFLRTDIWHRLNFTNKSHLIGKDVELKWTREDFLKMALRQAQRSPLFDELISKFSPVVDINQASEETMEKALELLWGIDRERGRRSKKVSRWVYERLTDANGSTFPRALIYLLEGARNKELEYQDLFHIQAPKDRLLRAQSLNEGLLKASYARCDELRQEYKELDDLGFFGYLSQLKQITRLEPIKSWWSENGTGKFSSFNDFLDYIKLMGLAAEYDNEQWKFADIYVHGFEMNRIGKL
ncbi:hypothetical protein A3844_26060 [Paenibacillus helianthi]|uniref:AAA domain-containing protein n=1 Tax=Paenibacillus helianthi TaxID=1349432 RepID=A0ABX3EG85_9BACL|nr:AAA family ATPase [Paenibacillus helianthi]OKP81517.1 hypothetical protein A3844_26060 [Paenibacillus helianthi]